MHQLNKNFHCTRHLRSLNLLKKSSDLGADASIPTDKLLEALLYHQPPLDLVQSILNLDPFAAHNRSQQKFSEDNILKSDDLTALQIAVQNEASLDVIDELIRANPYSLFVGNGKLDPLAYVQIWKSHNLELLDLLEHAVHLWDIFDVDRNCNGISQKFKKRLDPCEFHSDVETISPLSCDFTVNPWHEHKTWKKKDDNLTKISYRSSNKKGIYFEKSHRHLKFPDEHKRSCIEDPLSLKKKILIRSLEHIKESIIARLSNVDYLEFKNMSKKNTSRTSTRETKQHKNSLLSSDGSIHFALKKKEKDYDFSNCKHYAKTPQSTLFFLSHSEVDQKRFVTPCTQGKWKSQRRTDASYNQNRKSQKVKLLINSYDHHKMASTSRSRCGKKMKSNYKFSNIRTSIFVPMRK